MGTDLKLMPVGDIVEGNRPFAFSATLLDCPRSYDVFEEIRKLKPAPLAAAFYAYGAIIPDGRMKGEICYGVVKEDRYGDPIAFVRAGEIAEVLERAYYVAWTPITAYIKALPARDLVALFWC